MAGISHLQRPRPSPFEDRKVASIEQSLEAKAKSARREDPFAALSSIGSLLDEMKSQMASEIARAEGVARKERERADRLQDEVEDLVAALAEATEGRQQATHELRNIRSALKTLFANQGV